jgi:hypothetical protein
LAGLGAGLLARRALQSSMRAQIDPQPNQPAGSTEYQPVNQEDPDDPANPTDPADPADPAGEDPADPADPMPEPPDPPPVEDPPDLMTFDELEDAAGEAAGDALPAAEESALLAASGATEEAAAAEGVIEGVAEGVAAADTAAEVAAAEAIAAAGPDELTFGMAGVIAGAAALAAGTAAAAGIIAAYESAHKRPPSTTALTNQQVSATIDNLTGAVVQHPKLQSTLNAVSSAQKDGRPVYNVYNGTSTIVVAQLSNKDLIAAQQSYNSNPNVFKGQDPNVLTAMGLNPDLSKGAITGNFYNSNVSNPPPVIPPPPPPPAPLPTTGSSSNQKPGTTPATTPATTP